MAEDYRDRGDSGTGRTRKVMVAHVPAGGITELWGVELGLFMSDSLGRRIASRVLPRRTVTVEQFPHECVWGRVKKHSTTFPVQGPRYACRCGFVAPANGFPEFEED